MATEKGIFASGCFWGTEFYFKKLPGVISTQPGYIGGRLENPSYKDVCTGRTGHAEAVEVIFDPALTSYRDVTKLFFETHDPGQMNGQGPDIGTQYRSGIFYLNDAQKEIAEELIKTLKDNGYKVVTEVTAASEFYPAETYHHDYYGKNGQSPYCHRYIKKF